MLHLPRLLQGGASNYVALDAHKLQLRVSGFEVSGLLQAYDGSCFALFKNANFLCINDYSTPTQNYGELGTLVKIKFLRIILSKK